MRGGLINGLILDIWYENLYAYKAENVKQCDEYGVMCVILSYRVSDIRTGARYCKEYHIHLIYSGAGVDYSFIYHNITTLFKNRISISASDLGYTTEV